MVMTMQKWLVCSPGVGFCVDERSKPNNTALPIVLLPEILCQKHDVDINNNPRDATGTNKETLMPESVLLCVVLFGLLWRNSTIRASFQMVHCESTATEHASYTHLAQIVST